MVQDLRYAVRQLRKSPGFAFTVMLTLALSVGVATAVFCVIDAVILRPLPFAQPDRIVDIQSRSGSGYTQPASWPSYKDEREQAQGFSALAGYNNYFQVTMETPSGGPVLLDSVHSSDNFFQVFGVKPILGRTYLPGEEQDGKNEVVVLSYEVWQKYFDGDRGVVNRAVKLDGRTYTIIGVMPAGFRFPLGMRNAVYTSRFIDHDWMRPRGNHWMRTVARLKDGVTRERAQADLAHVFANIGRANPDTDGGRTVHLVPLGESIIGTTRGPLWTLLAAVMAVLAIGCVNVAGLLLARGVRREREMAMRSAIGATRTRIVRQVLTEGVLLAVLGAASGVGLAWLMLDLMRTFLIKALSRGADIHLNWKVLAASIAVSMISSLLAALYPSLRMSRVNPNTALKAGGSAGSERRQHRVRSGFIITQVALTMVLLVVAGLLIRMVTRYRHADLGFDPDHIFATDINLSLARYQGRDVIRDFYRPLVDRVSRIPGVRAAGFISTLPIQNWGSNSDIHIAGQPPNPPNREMLSEVRMVSSGYFDVFGIPLHRGRALNPTLDRPENKSPAVVVNEAFVRKFMPAGLDPTVQRIEDGDKPENWSRIVGVVGNVRQDIYEPPLAEHDYLIDEMDLKDRNDQLRGMTLVLRFDGDIATIIPALRNALHEVDPTVPYHEGHTMTEVVSETLVFQRMETWLFGIFGGLALVLALVGLYGLVNHEVEQATRDIGVRMALGASRPRILSMVMQRVSWMLGAGVLTGLVLTFLVRKLIGVVIYLDLQKDASSSLLIAILLLVAGAMAALIPACRAASIQPMQALRTE